MNDANFEYIRQLVLRHSGIVLEKGKEYLAEVRLTPLAHKNAFPTLDDFIDHLRATAASKVSQREAAEAMMTNETLFFRDQHPFEALKTKVFPELLQKRSAERQLNIWCAASSTGQEIYSIALLIQEYFPILATWTVRLIASDLSTKVLQKAQEGRFTTLEIHRGLPTEFLNKYFVKMGADYQIKEDIRRKIEFRQINLVQEWPSLPAIDILFMRNVLIYFDVATKRVIFGRIDRVLKPDGYLFLGGAESTLNLTDAFERVPLHLSGCFRKVHPQHAIASSETMAQRRP
jgi:chemotaxis protein methyltransferase CheR